MCAWPGCPMGRGWDETGDKGVCIVTVGEETSVRAVSVPGVRFHDLTVEVNGNAEASLAAVLPASSGSDFYRIVLTGTGNVDLQALQTLEARAGRAYVISLIHELAGMEEITFKNYPRQARFLLELRERVAAELDAKLE